MSSSPQVTENLKQFFKLQDHRVNIYKRFAGIFKQYLEDRNFTQYDQLVKGEIGPLFSEISQKVIKIEEHFNSHNRKDLGSLLRQVQQAEQEKLQLTMEEQITKKEMYVDEKTNPEFEQRLKTNIQQQEKIINKINELIQDLKEELEDDE